MTYLRMADAAYATNIPPGFPIVAGYYGGPGAYHIWPDSDWAMFPGYKLPIWVAAEGPKNGTDDGQAACAELARLRVPRGCRTALDMEEMQDISYVDAFAGQLGAAGYLVEVYGSLDYVFVNPPCNGYWVADYTSSVAAVDQVLQLGHVRGVQFSPGAGFDVSLVKAWTEGEMWTG